MMKEESTGGGDGGGCAANNLARVCDTCRSAACTVYCKADSAYLCGGCDARIHAANQVASRHERVWVCEACERAPAAFLCKADAASLCSRCDAEIHSANPLARRHHRVPILPIVGSLSAAASAGDENEEEEDEAASWLLMNPMMKNNGGHINHNNNNNNNNNNQNNGFLFGGEVDEYLDLVEYNFCAENQFTDQYNNNNNQQQQQQAYSVVPQKGYGGDSVVPVQNGVKDQLQHQQHNFHNFQLGLDQYETSISHSVSISSLDVGIVPESTSDISMCDISMSHSRPPKGTTIDLFSAPPPIQMPTQLTPMDREARVLRYREKKKTRKFEKTIRYASRKAYAETRPRIKGRFAKRTDVEVEVDQMFSATLMADAGYGIVPSF